MKLRGGILLIAIVLGFWKPVQLNTANTHTLVSSEPLDKLSTSQLSALHHLAFSELEASRKNILPWKEDLKQPVSNDLVAKFPRAATVEQGVSEVPTGAAKFMSREKTLFETETVLAARGVTVEVDIQSAPSNCLISYTPMFGGPALSAGYTEVVLKRVKPKGYLFVCKCGDQAIQQLLDCTSDVSFKFRCQAE